LSVHGENNWAESSAMLLPYLKEKEHHAKER
jgi:hypothetical protein